MSNLSERDLFLLQLVERGEGGWDSRTIDLHYSVRMAPTEENIHEALKRLAAAGLLDRDSSSGTGGRWSLTGPGRNALQEGGDAPN